MTVMPDTATSGRRGTRLQHRPFGIVVLAVLFVVRALLLLLALTAPSLPELGPVRRFLTMPAAIVAAVRETPALGTVVLGLAIVLVVAAILLWAGRRSGWVIGILTTGFFLVVDLYQASRGDVNTLWMALDVVVVFYLNQRDVRDRFSIGDTGPPR
ncbi:MAG TPA: hypothetical protein VJZ72_04845 [Candidatus Limnocylindrales bacterium]|nr:hypothetical protein [Candidatus Limnocylindrales bacterium]